MIRTILICRLIERCMNVVFDKMLHVTRTRPNVVIAVGMKFKHLVDIDRTRRIMYDYHNVTISVIAEECVECKVSHLVQRTTHNSYKEADRRMHKERLFYLSHNTHIDIYVDGCDVVRHRYNISQLFGSYDFLKMVENA